MDAGADVNAKDLVGNTALSEASYGGHTEIVAMLLEKGADVNAKNNDGDTALILASEEGHTEIVKLLIRKGATIPDDIDDREDLLKIKEQIEREVAREALTGVAIRLANTTPTTNEEYVTRQVLGQTVSNPDGKIIRPLTKEIGSYLGGKRKTRKTKKSNKRFRKTRSKRQNGGGIASSSIPPPLPSPEKEASPPNDADDMALIKASENGDTETVKMLLEKGADVNAKTTDYFGVTALIQASKNGHTEIVKKLLATKGILVNQEDNYGSVALIKASYNGHTEIVKLLLDAGANINAITNENITALHVAAIISIKPPKVDRGTEIVKMLLKEGADVNVKNENNRTALQSVIARDDGWPDYESDGSEEEDLTPKQIDIVKLLIRYGATIPSTQNENNREELKRIKEREVSRQTLTGVAVRLGNTTPTTKKESVIRRVLGLTTSTTKKESVIGQVLNQTVQNPEGKTIGRPLLDKITRYGGKRKTRKSRNPKEKPKEEKPRNINKFELKKEFYFYLTF